MSDKGINDAGLLYVLQKLKSQISLKGLDRQSRTYTGVTVTANSDPAGFLYFAKILPKNNVYGDSWKVLYKVTANMAGISSDNGSGRQTSFVYVHGARNTYYDYATWNDINNTSYRPYYQHAFYTGTKTGINAGYGHAMGLRFYSSYNPQNATYARTITFEILYTDNCTVVFTDPTLYANWSGTGSTNYYTRYLFDGTTQGMTMSGDRNDRDIYQREYNTIKAKSAITSGRLIVGDDNGYEHLAVGVTFDLEKRPLYINTNLAANATNYANLYSMTYDLTLETTLSSFTGIAGAQVFLVGTIDGDKFTVVSPGATCVKPTTEDGYVYMLLGKEGSNYSSSAKNRFHLYPNHPIFAFQNGKFGPYALAAGNAGTVNGHTVNADVPSGAKFTDTTYTAATAAPGKVTSASAQGSSTNYARQDHTHGIDLVTGDANGQVKIAGTNVSVKGLGAMAYKASLAASDIPSLDASKIGSGTLAVARGGTGKTTLKDAGNDILNALDTGSSTPVDADYYISQYVNGGTTTKTYHRRPMSALWSYISSKITLATGDNNGQVKIKGTNVSVKGLAALAYKASLAASDIPSLDAGKITSGSFDSDRISVLTDTEVTDILNATS